MCKSGERRAMEEQSITLKVLRLDDNSQIPTRSTTDAAGYDLYSVEDKTIPPFEKLLIDTGISIQLPEGTYGRIAPRSGLASRHFIDVGAGVIDRDYQGEIKVLLFNFSTTNFEIGKGDRIAQLIIEKNMTPETEIVTTLGSQTERGTRGFGSTDVIESDNTFTDDQESLAEVVRRNNQGLSLRNNASTSENRDQIQEWVSVDHVGEISEEEMNTRNVRRMKEFLKKCRKENNVLRSKHAQTVTEYQRLRSKLKISNLKFTALGHSMHELSRKYKRAERVFESWMRGEDTRPVRRRTREQEPQREISRVQWEERQESGEPRAEDR